MLNPPARLGLVVPCRRAAYDEALSRYDVLLMPTEPAKSRPLPQRDAPPERIIDLAFENIDNTCPFNLTHHPVLTLPCGMDDGCPVGMMLAGRHFHETTLYAVAGAFERQLDWRSNRD